ncbi:mCG1035144, partial [Mus musculus]
LPAWARPVPGLGFWPPGKVALGVSRSRKEAVPGTSAQLGGKIETHICPVGARVPYEAEAALELILRPSLPVMMSPSFRAYTPAPHLDLPDLAQCPAPGPSTQKHSLKPSCEPGQHLRQSCKEHRDWKL